MNVLGCNLYNVRCISAARQYFQILSDLEYLLSGFLFQFLGREGRGDAPTPPPSLPKRYQIRGWFVYIWWCKVCTFLHFESKFCCSVYIWKDNMIELDAIEHIKGPLAMQKLFGGERSQKGEGWPPKDGAPPPETEPCLIYSNVKLLIYCALHLISV